MKNLLETTGISSFTAGQKLSSESLNAMNSRINDLVGAMNLYLKSEVNVNLENNDPDGIYTLEAVRPIIPKKRRSSGMKVRFKVSGGEWTEYVYVGTSADDSSWLTDSNWVQSLSKKIDGGEW